MKPEYSKEDLIKHRLQKADETLYEAKSIAKKQFLRAAMNSIYYACYYAATAILLKEDIKPKTHKGVREMLGLHFVKTGKITFESGRFYSDAFDSRHSSDYEDFFVLNEKTITEFLLRAELFIDEIKAIYKEHE